MTVRHEGGGVAHAGEIGVHTALVDPGDAGQLPIDRSGHVPVVTAAAETRTVAAPSFIGQELLIYMKTDAGDCVITFAAAYNELGTTIYTLSEVGQFIKLSAVESGSAIVWRSVAQAGSEEDQLIGLQHQDTALINSEVIDLKDTNIEVVAAPAAGFAAVPVGVHMVNTFLTGAFVQDADTDQFALLYNGGSEIVEIGLAATFESFIEASATESFFVWFGEATGAGGVTPVAATAIDLDNNGATDLATGAGSISIRVYFMVVPTAAFS